MKNIVLCGITGKMGNMVYNYFKNNAEYNVIAGVSRHKSMIDNIIVYNDLNMCLKANKCDIILDFTNPTAGLMHLLIALDKDIPIIVGTTGINKKVIDELNENHKGENKKAIVSPNFSIGALIMIKTSEILSKYFKDVSIHELHHIDKKDSPSGTAIYLKEKMSDNNASVNIHSYRIGEIIAEHEVQFVSLGELISIKHASYDRKSFMEGIIFSLKKIEEVNEIIYGLENLIDL